MAMSIRIDQQDAPPGCGLHHSTRHWSRVNQHDIPPSSGRRHSTRRWSHVDQHSASPPSCGHRHTVPAVATVPVAVDPRKNAGSVFINKNSSFKSLIVLAIGLKDDNGDALIDLAVDPWSSLSSSTTRPTREDLMEGILCHYASENLSEARHETPASTQVVG